jgi:uncharacterized Fe-S center protein
MKIRPKVYFTKVINPQKLIEMYEILKKPLKGKVAVKVHSGEQGNKNFLRPEFLKPIVEHVKGTIVECNTAYPGARNSTEKHKKLMKEHAWSEHFKVDILDADADITLEIPDGLLIKKNFIGKNTLKYDSCLVISHFKGHQMGGFGGALKQLSIGFGSTAGKAYQHSGGKTANQNVVWSNCCTDKEFKEAMADAASSIVKFFRGNMAFINMMVNISIDCDCDGNAKPPVMKDIGILSSTDPVALDKACLDLIYNSDDPGKKQLIERIESKLGPHIIESSVQLGFGSDDYELINVDNIQKK